MSGPLGRQSQADVSFLGWVPGTELKSSARITSTLKHPAVSPAPKVEFYFKDMVTLN